MRGFAARYGVDELPIKSGEHVRRRVDSIQIACEREQWDEVDVKHTQNIARATCREGESTDRTWGFTAAVSGGIFL